MAHVGEVVSRPYPAFRDRAEAGRKLADFLLDEGASVEVVIAVPSGGVAVGRPLAERLGVPFDMILVRKLPLPMEPEAGFGAITLGGDMVLNDALVSVAGLSEDVIEEVVGRVLEELRQRRRRFTGGRRPLELAGKNALLVDDGLASGFTMRAAIKEVGRKGPRNVAVAVPDAPLSTIKAIEPLVDELYCLVAQRRGSFAVASFYRFWHDLTDDEVIEIQQRQPPSTDH